MVMNESSAIEVDSIVTRFGTKTVHDGVSFSVGRGTVTAIIGGSGSGKSVLFREMLGLLRPTAGRIKVAGAPVWELDPAELSKLRSRVGVLFQQGALLSALTVAENVAAPLLEWTNIRGGLLRTLVEGKLLLSGLPLDAAEKMPSELSGGMVKRAALARALALEPEILFLDEPTSGLDPVMARAFDELIRTLCDSLRITVCMITHDLASIRNITDDIVALGSGRVIVQGPFEKVSRFDDPWITSYFSAER
jgi:phospholipid/cholesterol/gamma-HCH transport system ATP-binding protein